jgi:hypothetical protein
MTTLNSLGLTQGIFTVGSTGKVAVDYLFDGGSYKGEIAIFSITGMENLEVGSADFIKEATKRALSNSTQGYVVIQDYLERARFSGSLAWENNANSGEYKGLESFDLLAGDRFAMMLIPNSTVSNLAAYPNTTSSQIQPLFSFGRTTTASGSFAQMVDVTGEGNTFAWEDVSQQSSDRDYNDAVFQIQGATANASLIDTQINQNRNWLTTEVGQELLSYANRPRFTTGSFEVNQTGQVQVDYLYDGGGYQGQLAVFSLAGMEQYTPGSVEFIQEAARRALTNSTEGRVLIRDGQEGAKFSTTLAWENNFNTGTYQGIQRFTMNAGDQVAFMLVQNNTVQSVYANPNNYDKAGQTPLFSLPEANLGGTPAQQMVALDKRGTFAFEDQRVNSSSADKDYNDFVFQVAGLEGQVPLMDSLVNTQRDFRSTSTGQELLNYTSRQMFTKGVFEVGATGQVQFDYLYDGGWFQSEMAVFSLNGMENLKLGSNEFIQEAARRAVSNTNQGYVFIKDSTEGAKFNDKVSWENNFNSGSYKGIKTFSMNAGEQFAFMLVQNTTTQEIANNVSRISQWGKMAIFSLPEANPGGSPINQMVKVDNNGTYAFEDVRIDLGQSDQDYNDVVFQVKGASGSLISMDQAYNGERDWRKTTTGQDLLTYANRASFDNGVFVAGNSGQITVDFLYDGGDYHGEVGIFSLAGMENLQIGSDAFINTALQRALSNSTSGRVIVQDNLTGTDEGAKFSANLAWEGQYNEGQYLGKKTLQLNAGETYGLVLVSDGTLQDELLNPSTGSYNKPLFSMSNANANNAAQFGQVTSSQNSALVAFEDVHLNNGSNRDYNDIVLGFQGATFVNVPNLNQLIPDGRQWQNMEIGQTIINDFHSAV